MASFSFVSSTPHPHCLRCQAKKNPQLLIPYTATSIPYRSLFVSATFVRQEHSSQSLHISPTLNNLTIWRHSLQPLPPPPPHPSSHILICTLNILSMLNSQHIISLNDFTNNNNPDVLALTKTWIHVSPVERIDATPHGYSSFLLFSALRFSSSHPSKPISAGGIAVVLKEPVSIHNASSHSYSFFEYSSVTLKLRKYTFYFVQYLPTSSVITVIQTILNLLKPIFIFPFQCC